jgi:hypothetical protein
MTSSPSPKLPAWIFYAADAALLIAAGFIAAEAPRPLPNGAIFAVVACVIVGTIVALVPRIVEYEREKNATLDERQRALEALAQTVANSAEQISVAASGLHAIAELSNKNLRHAEQLPHKLQDKIAEFQAQLANAADTEKEELEKELVALRSSESERLESISDRIAKSTAELSRVEAALQKQLAAQQALVKTAASVAPPTASAPAPASASTPASAPAHPPAAPVSTVPAPPPAPHANVAAAVATGTGSTALTEPAAENESDANALAHPPKRLRKVRREEVSTSAAANAATASTTGTNPGFPAEEPAPAKLHEIAPVVPGSQAPYPDRLPEPAKESAAPTPPPPAPPIASPDASAGPTLPTAAVTKPARKRAEKRSGEATVENLFGIEITSTSLAVSSPPVRSAAAAAEFTQVSPEEAAPSVAIAADGATRLLVTAYIGIGNRLFIRGVGPGLSWEKGVPLQFVSIGKWRWETADATTPIKFKLYKNDELECTSIGLQTLSAGHQQELSATF